MAPDPALAVTGLTEAEVEERRARGEVNRVESQTSRSVAGILRGNILTRFNAIITALLVVVLVFGDPRDGLFGAVMVINAAIGIVQELRAKYTLDRLTVLATPRVGVIRNGTLMDVPSPEVVLDDVVVLRLGDQVPVDGEVIDVDGLQINEALLTGEADPVGKVPGDRAMSGSFVVAGSGVIRAVAVGEDAYANRLAAEAREFTLANSELRDGIDSILRLVQWLLIPTGALLVWSQFSVSDSAGHALVGAVAGIVAMVPQGLVLLVSMAFAVAVIRLGRRNVLVQELPAVETLARVDTVCVDKTGTLTAGRIVAEALCPLGDHPESVLRDAIGALAHSDPSPNPTSDALAEAYPDPGWHPSDVVPFSSNRKWSAAAFADNGHWVLGAPEVLLADVPAAVAESAAAGKRTIVFGTSAGDPSDRIAGFEAVGFATLIEEIRPDAADTIRYFVEQGVSPKVISGDSPLTVSAIAAQVGVPGADKAVDARRLGPGGTEHFEDAVNENAVFGRVVPEQKREMVAALQAEHHTVAMTGDGVNDVLALKAADIGIAMGAGSPATRAVAQVVLLDNRFATLPDVVAEGRRIIGNMERVASLFLTKTVYATILAVLIGFAGLAFPFLPRHLTLIGSLTIGIPGFLLSFEPTEEPVRPGLLQRVFRFAVPAGLAAALVTFQVYGLNRSTLIDSDIPEARTAATVTMLLLGLWILIELTRPFNRGRLVLVLSMGAMFAAVLGTPFGREFFELVLPSPIVWLSIVLSVATGVFLIHAFLALADSAVGQILEREMNGVWRFTRKMLGRKD